MAMGKRRQHAKQATMWVATKDLPPTAGHPFYALLSQILAKHDFDGYVEEFWQRFYADDVGRCLVSHVSADLVGNAGSRVLGKLPQVIDVSAFHILLFTVTS